MTNEANLSLDERYLAFRNRTAPVFEAYPQMEPMRHLLFRQLVEAKTGADWRDGIKHITRPLRRKAVSSGPLAKSDVLIWLETPREVVSGALMPVVEELRQRGVSVQIVSHGAGAVEAQAHRCVPPSRVRTPAWAAAAWSALVATTPDLQAPGLRTAFEHEATHAQSVLDEAARILDVVQPRIALTAMTNLPGGGALAVAAQPRKIPTLLLQHGITQVFYTPTLADLMATWGEASNDTLASLGVARETLLPLGSPRHDGVRASEVTAARAALCRALGLPERPTLVFFSNGNDLVRNGQAPVECAQWLEAAARALKNELNVVVRLHPNENGALYRETPHLKTTKNEVDLNATLDGCDAVASLCSTVLYEALLFGKPVWQFFAEGWPELADNWKHALARRVESREALQSCCAALAGGTNEGVAPPDAVEKVFANHGRAAQAIADEIVRRVR